MRFSLATTIVTDYPAFASAIAIPIFWLVYFGFPYLRPQSEGSPPIVLAVSTSLVCAIVLIWRVQRVSQLFASGRSAPGRVTRVAISRDRGRLEFSFEHNGDLVHSWSPVHKTKAVLSLQPGDSVDVLFDPNRPATAIVRQLYQAG